MKKIVLFLFLIFSLANMNAQTWLERTYCDADFSATQVSIHEDLSLMTHASAYLDFVFVDASLLFEKYQPAAFEKDVGIGCSVNFQTTVKNILVPLATSAGYRMNYSAVTEEAVSPKCRTVLFNAFGQKVSCVAVNALTQAVSPNCRGVITIG